MASQLVDDVRRLIRDRVEAGHPLTDLERVFLLAAIAPKATAGDVVDELEEAIRLGRSILLGTPPSGWAPTQVEAMRRQAASRLLAAARAVLDFDPFREPYDPTAALPTERLRPERADVDG